MKTVIELMLVTGLLGLVWAAGMAWAETAWIDDIANSVSFYKTNYPDSNWEPYSNQLRLVRRAVHHGDQQVMAEHR